MTGKIEHFSRLGKSLDGNISREYSAFRITGEDGNQVIISPSAEDIVEMIAEFLKLQNKVDKKTGRQPVFISVKKRIRAIFETIELGIEKNSNLFDDQELKWG